MKGFFVNTFKQLDEIIRKQTKDQKYTEMLDDPSPLIEMHEALTSFKEDFIAEANKVKCEQLIT